MKEKKNQTMSLKLKKRHSNLEIFTKVNTSTTIFNW